MHTSKYEHKCKCNQAEEDHDELKGSAAAETVATAKAETEDAK